MAEIHGVPVILGTLASAMAAIILPVFFRYSTSRCSTTSSASTLVSCCREGNCTRCDVPGKGEWLDVSEITGPEGRAAGCCAGDTAARNARLVMHHLAVQTFANLALEPRAAAHGTVVGHCSISAVQQISSNLTDADVCTAHLCESGDKRGGISLLELNKSRVVDQLGQDRPARVTSGNAAEDRCNACAPGSYLMGRGVCVSRGMRPRMSGWSGMARGNASDVVG